MRRKLEMFVLSTILTLSIAVVPAVEPAPRLIVTIHLSVEVG